MYVCMYVCIEIIQLDFDTDTFRYFEESLARFQEKSIRLGYCLSRAMSHTVPF